MGSEQELRQAYSNARKALRSGDRAGAIVCFDTLARELQELPYVARFFWDIREMLLDGGNVLEARDLLDAGPGMLGELKILLVAIDGQDSRFTGDPRLN